jgi:hypothetical protein
MSTLLTTQPSADRHARATGDPPRWAPEAGPTLDDVVSRTWEVLRAGAPAACMVCGAELSPRRAASGAAAFAGGRCAACGTALG